MVGERLMYVLDNIRHSKLHNTDSELGNDDFVFKGC